MVHIQAADYELPYDLSVRTLRNKQVNHEQVPAFRVDIRQSGLALEPGKIKNLDLIVGPLFRNQDLQQPAAIKAFHLNCK